MSLTQLLFGFKGRVGRLTYAIMFVSMIAASLVAIKALGLSIPNKKAADVDMMMLPASLLVLGINILVMWISLAIGAKRLHDLDKSGWWQLIGIANLPIILLGGILSLIFPPVALVVTAAMFIIGLWSLWIAIQMLFFPGSPGANDYGERDPIVFGGGDSETDSDNPIMARMARSVTLVASSEPVAAAPVERRVEQRREPGFGRRADGGPNRRSPPQGFGRRSPA